MLGCRRLICHTSGGRYGTCQNVDLPVWFRCSGTASLSAKSNPGRLYQAAHENAAFLWFSRFDIGFAWRLVLKVRPLPTLIGPDSLPRCTTLF